MKKALLFLIVSIVTTGAIAQCGNVYGDLVINEFMARNIVHSDEYGEYDDWVEIMNTTDDPISLNGYFLSDNHGNRTRYSFPDMTLDPGGYVIVWCDGQPEQGQFHTEFGLNGSVGERIILVNPDTVVIDHFDFSEIQTNEHSLSRYPNGYGPFRFALPTPGLDNNETDYRGLVINEFLAINENSGTDEFGNNLDWIELYNNRDIPLNLGGYFLSDKSNNPDKYEFPEPTILAAGGYTRVWAAGFAGISDSHADFALSGDGEYVHLYNKDTMTLDFVWFGPQLADVSIGRYENGVGQFGCLEPSLLEENILSTVSIDEVGKEEDILFSVYPVPATDFVNIQLMDTGNGIIQLFSAYGQHIANYSYQGSGPHYIDLAHLSKGVYLVKIGNHTKRIVMR